MHRLSSLLYCFLLFLFCSNANATLVSPAVNQINISYILTQSESENNGQATAEINYSENGVTQKLIPIPGVLYNFALVNGDFFQETLSVNTASGATPDDAGTATIGSRTGLNAPILFGGLPPSVLIPLLTLVVLASVDSDGLDALTQAQQSYNPFTPALPASSFFARSDTLLCDNKNFTDTGTCGAEISYEDLEELMVQEDITNQSGCTEDCDYTFTNVANFLTSTSSESTGIGTSIFRLNVGAPVPLPAAFWLFVSALLGLLWKGRKAHQSAA